MARRKTRIERQLDEELLNENLPVDFLPFSNGEHFPEEPKPDMVAAMKIADQVTEEYRRRFGLSRREFVRTTAAFGIGLWALNVVNPGRYGYYALGAETIPAVNPTDPLWDACALDNEMNPDNPALGLQNLPGEFILDVQSHHVTNDTKWRVLQPVHHAFICGLFGAGEAGSHNSFQTSPDLCDNVGRWHYIKDLLLDSATTACVLSPIPSAPDEQQPLPFKEANETAQMIENLAQSMRVVTHGYVMPNRGWFHEYDVGYVPAPAGGQPLNEGTGNMTPGSPLPPQFLQDELDWMEERALHYGRYLRGWKVYTPYGDVPFSSGMRHDDMAGFAMNDKIRELHEKYGVPKVLASHKGVWLPTFDEKSQACDDVPRAAMEYPDINFIIYHSGGGWKGESYPTDAAGAPPDADKDIPLNDYTQGIIGLLANLKANGLAASTPANIPAGLAHGNSPNVYVDLGSVFPSHGPDEQALFLGTMIKHLGTRRICWGTDCLWSGSPQPRIVALRTLEFTDIAKEMFNLPWGLDGDRYDPRVNALTGQAFGYQNAYSQNYCNDYPSLKDPKIGGNWPTMGGSHPERSLRNGIFGRNAAEAYGVDADAQYNAMKCDEVQKMKDEYLVDRVNNLASAGPSRSNMIYGPRTRRETIAMLNGDWKKNGWRA